MRLQSSSTNQLVPTQWLCTLFNMLFICMIGAMIGNSSVSVLPWVIQSARRQLGLISLAVSSSDKSLQTLDKYTQKYVHVVSLSEIIIIIVIIII